MFYKCEDCEDREEYFIRVIILQRGYKYIIPPILSSPNRENDFDEHNVKFVFIIRISLSICVKYEYGSF